jgi:hypothetical protein
MKYLRRILKSKNAAPFLPEEQYENERDDPHFRDANYFG